MVAGADGSWSKDYPDWHRRALSDHDDDRCWQFWAIKGTGQILARAVKDTKQELISFNADVVNDKGFVETRIRKLSRARLPLPAPRLKLQCLSPSVTIDPEFDWDGKDFRRYGRDVPFLFNFTVLNENCGVACVLPAAGTADKDRGVQFKVGQAPPPPRQAPPVTVYATAQAAGSLQDSAMASGGSATRIGTAASAPVVGSEATPVAAARVWTSDETRKDHIPMAENQPPASKSQTTTGPVIGGAVSQEGDATVVTIGSFNHALNNSLNQVQGSAAQDPVKQRMAELKGYLEQLGKDPHVSDDDKEAAQTWFGQLADLIKKKPDPAKANKSLLSLTADGLVGAAKTCAAMAAPIATTVKTLLGLFGIS